MLIFCQNPNQNYDPAKSNGTFCSDRSMRFTFHPLSRLLIRKPIRLLGGIQPRCNYCAKAISSQISITVCCHVFTYTAEWTGASWSERLSSLSWINECFAVDCISIYCLPPPKFRQHNPYRMWPHVVIYSLFYQAVALLHRLIVIQTWICGAFGQSESAVTKSPTVIMNFFTIYITR